MATGLVLAACAGTGPQNPSATSTAGPNATPASLTAANSGSTKLPKGFRRVTNNGQEYICQRQASTASRTEVVETCLSAAEFEEREKKGQDFLQGFQNRAVEPPVGNKAFTPGF
jgi:hypothetical protein